MAFIPWAIRSERHSYRDGGKKTVSKTRDLVFHHWEGIYGHNGVIQRNALKSWTLAAPDAEVILLGDEDGAAETEVLPSFLMRRSGWRGGRHKKGRLPADGSTRRVLETPFWEDQLQSLRPDEARSKGHFCFLDCSDPRSRLAWRCGHGNFVAIRRLFSLR